MARIYPLFSSSAGNVTLISSGAASILIDAGVSYRQLTQALEENLVSLDSIKALFITHIHSDHIKGLKTLSKKLDIPIYTQTRSIQLLQQFNKVDPDRELTPFDTGTVTVSGFTVERFTTYHDTPVSQGYRVTCPDGRSCAVCTDTGKLTPEIHRLLSTCQAVLLESNFDETMLSQGDYTPQLKARIMSEYGHLSNTDCARELQALLREGVTTFILGHLSERNNTPHLAESAALKALEGSVRGEDYSLHIAAPSGGRAIVF